MIKSLAELYVGNGSDKGTVHSFIEVYEDLLRPYRHSAIEVLEIGLCSGHSLLLWEQYFTAAKVRGIDICEQPYGGIGDLRPLIAQGTHLIYLMDACSTFEVNVYFKDMLFDVVIDDASHAPVDQSKIYANFKDKMSTSGIYIVEDVADIEQTRALFTPELLGKRTLEVLDRRSIKGRFDDVLFVIR